MGYAEVSYSGLLLPCKSVQRCPWVAAIALRKAVGTVPSDPSIERELAQGKYVYGLLGSGEWFWQVCYGHQKGRSGRGQGGLGKRHMDEPTEVDTKRKNLSTAQWCLSESFCHKQGIKQAGRWYGSSS